MVFSEIMPQALTLMTDVFGNYVVQKVKGLRGKTYSLQVLLCDKYSYSLSFD